MPQIPDLDQVLGGIALASNRPTCTKESSPAEFLPTLELLQQGDKDTALYMLLAICLDLTRRMDYFFHAAKPTGALAEPALAERIWSENQRVNDAGGLGDPAAAWKERARVLYDIVAASRLQTLQEHNDLFAALGYSREQTATQT